MEKKQYSLKEIQSMLKLIPNGMVIGLEDLEEIFTQDDRLEK